MDRKDFSAYNSIIDFKEKENLYFVLNKYDFNVKEIYKSRSAYKVSTNNGYVCLKKMKHGEHKAINGNILVEHLISNGFYNIPKYYKTKKGELYVKSKKYIYYISEWIDGIESDLSDINEAVQSVIVLAKFHVASKGIDISKLKIKNNLRNWPVIFNDNLNDLQKFKKIILSKKNKDYIDIAYLKHINSFYNRGLEALNFLNESRYSELSVQACDNKTISHDSIYYQNIVKKDNSYYLVDLDSIIVDLQINDLGKLIRRLMYKSSYKWDFSKAKILIDAYSSITPLTKDELEIMLALIVFPHKFWKLGKKKYLKNTTWNQNKYIHKLNKMIECDELEQKFLEDYITFLREI